MATVAISFKTDKNVKIELDRIAHEIGISTSSLLNILVKRTVVENGIPFDVKASERNLINRLDEETQRELVKQLAIEQGLIEDDSTVVTDVEQYFKNMGY